jgi:hypothetical protein
MQIKHDFDQLVPASSKFLEQLTKIFKKKIKRAKKKQLAEGEDDAGSDDDEDVDDSDMDDMSSDDEEEEEEEEFCPPGCDPALYEKVCELRDKRLDQEEVLNEYSKAVEQLKKDNDALVKKEKLIDGQLRETEKEIQAFQTHKQSRLNQLDVVITLKMHQVQCLVDGKQPADLSECLVFTNAGLQKLRNRIRELKDEKQALHAHQRKLRDEHALLLKAKKAKELKLAEVKARCLDVQMLKFGQEIDLEVLERMSVNKTGDLKEKLRRQEMKAARDLDAWQKRVQEASAELAEITNANTERLRRVAELTAQQQKLEQALNATQSKPVSEAPSFQSNTKEREQLINLIKLQAKEMEALKAEINMLRRKGGHVYTPVVKGA